MIGHGLRNILHMAVPFLEAAHETDACRVRHFLLEAVAADTGVERSERVTGVVREAAANGIDREMRINAVVDVVSRIVTVHHERAPGADLNVEARDKSQCHVIAATRRELFGVALEILLCLCRCNRTAGRRSA